MVAKGRTYFRYPNSFFGVVLVGASPFRRCDSFVGSLLSLSKEFFLKILMDKERYSCPPPMTFEGPGRGK
jgi:hypothetical protein